MKKMIGWMVNATLALLRFRTGEVDPKPEGEVMATPPVTMQRLMKRLKAENTVPKFGVSMVLDDCRRLSQAGDTIERYRVSGNRHAARTNKSVRIGYDVEICGTTVLRIRRTSAGSWCDTSTFHPVNPRECKVAERVKQMLPRIMSALADSLRMQRTVSLGEVAFCHTESADGSVVMTIVGDAWLDPPLTVNCSSDGTHAPDQFDIVYFSMSYPPGESMAGSIAPGKTKD